MCICVIDIQFDTRYFVYNRWYSSHTTRRSWILCHTSVEMGLTSGLLKPGLHPLSVWQDTFQTGLCDSSVSCSTYSITCRLSKFEQHKEDQKLIGPTSTNIISPIGKIEEIIYRLRGRICQMIQRRPREHTWYGIETLHVSGWLVDLHRQILVTVLVVVLKYDW